MTVEAPTAEPLSVIPLPQSAARVRGIDVAVDFIMPEFLSGPENVAIVETFSQLPPEQWPDQSPVVLFGPPGVGKTAIALAMLRAALVGKVEPSVAAVSATDFARSLAMAIDSDDMPRFRSRFRGCEALLIDNVHQIAGRQFAEDELTRTMDAISDAGGVILMTASQLPGRIPNLASQLVSRLSGGLCLGVDFPCPAIHRRCIEHLATLHPQAIMLSGNKRQLLAERIPHQTPLTKTRGIFLDFLHLCAQLADRPSSLAVGRVAGPDVLRDDDAAVKRIDEIVERRDARSTLTLHKIALAVAKHCGCEVTDLRSPSRRSDIVRARSLAIHLARDLKQFSLHRIGKYFGGRDHTTILHATRSFSARLADEPALQQQVQQLRRRLIGV